MELQAKTTSPKNARHTRSVNLTKTKRKRNPCDDNDPGSETRAVSIKVEPGCAEYAEKDPVELEPINANAAICAGKTCWDYDSFVKSIRQESENRAGAGFRDPLTRNLVDINAVARARPAGALTTAEETVAPVASNAPLDPDFQMHVDEGNTQDRDLDSEDEAVYEDSDSDSDDDDDLFDYGLDDYESDSSDWSVPGSDGLRSDSDDESNVNEMITELLQRSRTLLDQPLNPSDLRDMGYLREQLKALIVVSYSSPRGGPFSDWADVGAAFPFLMVGVDVPNADNLVPRVQTNEQYGEECSALLRVLKRLLQLYGLAEFELGNRETGPKWTCSPRTEPKALFELKQVYAKLVALRLKQQEVGKRIKSIITYQLESGIGSLVVVRHLLSTGWIGLVGHIEDDVYDRVRRKLEHFVYENFDRRVTGRLPSSGAAYYNIQDVESMKDYIPLPLRLALLDEELGINTGPNTKATLAALKRPSNTGKELCSAERTTFHRHPVTQDYAPRGFAWVSIDCWRGPKVPATLIEGYYLKPRGG